MKDLRAKHIYQYINYKLDQNELKRQSINRHIANLKSVIEFAFSLDLFDNNLTESVKMLNSAPFESNIYSHEQISNLFKFCHGIDIGPAIFLTGIYGFRRGEILGLIWENIDFKNKQIHINETRTIAGREILKETKTLKSRRKMPMNGLC